MSDEYFIDDGGVIHFKNREEQPETEYDKLMAEYVDLEHQVVNSIAHHTDDPVKVARYHELKKILGILETSDVFKQGAKILQHGASSALLDTIKRARYKK